MERDRAGLPCAHVGGTRREHMAGRVVDLARDTRGRLVTGIGDCDGDGTRAPARRTRSLGGCARLRLRSGCRRRRRSRGGCRRRRRSRCWRRRRGGRGCRGDRHGLADVDLRVPVAALGDAHFLRDTDVDRRVPEVAVGDALLDHGQFRARDIVVVAVDVDHAHRPGNRRRHRRNRSRRGLDGLNGRHDRPHLAVLVHDPIAGPMNRDALARRTRRHALPRLVGRGLQLGRADARTDTEPTQGLGVVVQPNRCGPMMTAGPPEAERIGRARDHVDIRVLAHLDQLDLGGMGMRLGPGRHVGRLAVATALEHRDGLAVLGVADPCVIAGRAPDAQRPEEDGGAARFDRPVGAGVRAVVAPRRGKPLRGTDGARMHRRGDLGSDPHGAPDGGDVVVAAAVGAAIREPHQLALGRHSAANHVVAVRTLRSMRGGGGRADGQASQQHSDDFLTEQHVKCLLPPRGTVVVRNQPVSPREGTL